MSDDTFYFPLSFAQQRLWFLDKLVPGTAFYNLHSAVPMTFVLNHGALERVLNEIVRRHESLRTTFVTVDEQPRQRVAAELAITLPFTDLRDVPPQEREQQAQAIIQSEAQHVFDLTTGPLIRAHLIQTDANKYIFALTIHHIVCDGWSMGILWQEINTLYTAFALGRESTLPELPIQYADFSVWQKEWLEGELLEQQLEYWRGQLEDLPNLELPADRPRPPLASYRGAQHPISFPAALCDQLSTLR